jgi:hypothetical protein
VYSRNMTTNSKSEARCSHPDEEMRCHCGKMLAKLTKDGVIIRCARCKREMKIDLDELILNLDTGWADVSFKEKTA